MVTLPLVAEDKRTALEPLLVCIAKIPSRTTEKTIEYSLYLFFIFCSYLRAMLINELAKTTSISIHTIRYYEKYGLVKGKQKPEVKSNQYFHYDAEVVDKLQLIRDAKAAGFTLNEIRQLIDAWYGKKFTVAKKLFILDEKLSAIDEKIEQLKNVKKLIGQFKKQVAELNCVKQQGKNKPA